MTGQAVEARVDTILRRDLTRYFNEHAGRPALVTYEYLRAGPTITGIAHPKYYVWVHADLGGDRVPVEGAARIALVDSVAEVTHFFQRDPGTIAPPTLDSVFPAPVTATIRRQYWK